MTAQAHYRRRTESAVRQSNSIQLGGAQSSRGPRSSRQSSGQSTLAWVGRALLMLIGLVLVVASCTELQTLASSGWGSTQVSATALSAAHTSLDPAQLVPSVLLALGAVASFVASTLLPGRATS